MRKPRKKESRKKGRNRYFEARDGADALGGEAFMVSEKRAFLNDLPKRQVRDALLVICGETNIVSLNRRSSEFYDPYSFADRLGDMQVRVILNPIHDYMRRYEMPKKREYYSHQGRTVISVWNQGKVREAHMPWTVFHDGYEQTSSVVELPRPFSERPDIRIGLLDLSFLP